MALFGLGKKKDETKSSCCCGGTCTPETMEKAEEKKNSMGVKILGGGCAKCNQLEAATVEALTEWIQPLNILKNGEKLPLME